MAISTGINRFFPTFLKILIELLNLFYIWKCCSTDNTDIYWVLTGISPGWVGLLKSGRNVSIKDTKTCPEEALIGFQQINHAWLLVSCRAQQKNETIKWKTFWLDKKNLKLYVMVDPTWGNEKFLQKYWNRPGFQRSKDGHVTRVQNFYFLVFTLPFVSDLIILS